MTVEEGQIRLVYLQVNVEVGFVRLKANDRLKNSYRYKCSYFKNHGQYQTLLVTPRRIFLIIFRYRHELRNGDRVSFA